jgi:hypothetical protein
VFTAIVYVLTCGFLNAFLTLAAPLTCHKKLARLNGAGT